MWISESDMRRTESAVKAIFSQSKQQKTYQGTIGTQEGTSIGSKSSLGTSKDPTGPLKLNL